MELTSSSFAEGDRIPGEFALGVPDPQTHATFGPNRNPALTWTGLPAGTRSLVLICHDPDAPDKELANLEGRPIPAEVPRADFYHWVLVDLSPDTEEVAEGAHGEGMTPRGKPGPDAPGGARHGLNSYTEWFEGEESMEGEYFGYDGPFPPWNDQIPHRYVFTLYATDLDRCPVDGKFRGPDVLAAIDGHVLDRAQLTGIYSLNPDVEV